MLGVAVAVVVGVFPAVAVGVPVVVAVAVGVTLLGAVAPSSRKIISGLPHQ